MAYRAVDELEKGQEEIKERLVEQFITKSSISPDFKIKVVGVEVYCTLPAEEEVEQAMIDASYHNGLQLDLATRDPRFRRFVLATAITRIADTEFEEGDESLKRQFLGRLPQLIFDQIWESFLMQRDALMLILSGVDDVVKKSPASPSGGGAGSSSKRKGKSASTEKDSPDSTSSS